jgi:hypothetical protein
MEIETRIRQAKFTFDSDCGLAVYLDCDIIGQKNKGATEYVTDLFELNYIKQILNAGKTGHAKETFDQEALDTLVGMKAVFYEEDDRNTLHYKYIIPNSKGDES